MRSVDRNIDAIILTVSAPPALRTATNKQDKKSELDDRIVSLFATADNGVLLHDSFPMEPGYYSELTSTLLPSTIQIFDNLDSRKLNLDGRLLVSFLTFESLFRVTGGQRTFLLLYSPSK